MAIKVLLVDDHAVVRQGLHAVLDTTDDIQVVGEAASGEEAVRLVPLMRPDLVLLDMMMAGMNGVETTVRLKALDAGLKVLLLTSYAYNDQVQPALHAGADGYLLKTASAAGVMQAIRTVAAGQQVLDAGVLSSLGQTRTRGLSSRELEVLGLVASGLSNAEIADRLVITVRTVKAHISNLLQKLHLTDRTQLAIWALHHTHQDGM